MDCWINLTVLVQEGLEVLFPVVDYSVDILDEMSVISELSEEMSLLVGP